MNLKDNYEEINNVMGDLRINSKCEGGMRINQEFIRKLGNKLGIERHLEVIWKFCNIRNRLFYD